MTPNGPTCWTRSPGRRPARCAGDRAATSATSRPDQGASEYLSSKVGTELGDHHPDPGTDDPTVATELLRDPRDRMDRKGEPHALGERDHGRVDPDDGAVQVDERPSAVAGVDRGVRLDESLEDEVRAGKGSTERAHDPDGNGRPTGETERVPDREHELTDPEVLGGAQTGGRQVDAVDLDDRDVRRFVSADDVAREVASVRQVDADLSGPLDHVLVRDQVAGRVDHHGGRARRFAERRGASSATEVEAFDPGDARSDRLDRGRDPALELAERH